MAVDAEKRIRHWDQKFKTDRVKASLDALRPGMLEHVKQAFAALVEMETQVKQVLDGAGVQTILYVAYLNFGRQLHKLSRQKNVSGPSFALAAQVLLDKWASRSLDPDVLATIRNEVFNIGPP